MIDINRHKFFLVQILKDIYTDIELANYLGFKGGSALMFFYDLPRFSVDLDFNLLDPGKLDPVYEKVRRIMLKYGTIFDEAKKFFGPVIVLDYGMNERKLKVELSTRSFNDKYEIRNLLGINIKVMTSRDMFTHKLCALLDRNRTASRDIFDCWFFMQRQTPVNPVIIEQRMKISYADYMKKCIERIESLSNKALLAGLGELVDDKMKGFVKTRLKTEILTLLRFYREHPIIE